MSDDYKWIPFYMEFADKLLEYKDNRTELIEKVLKLWDNIDMDMPLLELNNEVEDMDPFTIFGLFNKKLTDTNRISIIQYFKDMFHIQADVPTVFTGIPMINPQKGTFYWFKDTRGNHDIDNLWNVFEYAIKYSNNKNKITRKKFISAYNKVLNQIGIRWNITMGLFWIRPYDFINLDSRSRWFLSNSNNIDKDFASLISSFNNPPSATQYLSLIDECKNILENNDYDFNNIPELSNKAYIVSIEDDKREKIEKEELNGMGDVETSDEINYWLYAPGHGATKWDAFYKEGLMGIGWKLVGNLESYDKREQIISKLQQINNNTSKYTNDSLALWQFSKEIKKGDIVFAKKGMREIIGYGIVDGDYFYDEALDKDYYHMIHVNWKEKGHWKYNGTLAMKTLTKITDFPNLIDTISNFFETDPTDIEPEVIYEEYAVDDFLDEVYITKEDYNRLIGILEHKKNLILQGSPGVGKTFISKRLAYSLIGAKDKSRVCLVQFHQSYSYEDFIMGYRPTGDGFELKQGVFYEFCKRAQDDEEHDYYFIIDEINRGNLSKIFGELFMLLEKDKRGKKNKISLLYNDELFYIPSNVYIMGMMNTADCSLAMIDYALRRRFTFYKLTPAFDNETFINYQNNLDNPKFNRIIEKIKELNDEISTDDSLGEGFMIGHSYFSNLNIDEVDEKLVYIIEYEIIPLLEEYWFDESDKVENWSNILRSVLYDSN